MDTGNSPLGGATGNFSLFVAVGAVGAGVAVAAAVVAAAVAVAAAAAAAVATGDFLRLAFDFFPMMMITITMDACYGRSLITRYNIYRLLSFPLSFVSFVLCLCLLLVVSSFLKKYWDDWGHFRHVTVNICFFEEYGSVVKINLYLLFFS